MLFFLVDTDIPIEFPDAVELRIVFDKRSRTESGCDYIRFYQDQVVVGEPKYHGRSGGVWAGVGLTPPLIVKGSSVEARFHSDGSNNDWGYHFTGTFSGTFSIQEAYSTKPYSSPAQSLPSRPPCPFSALHFAPL